jgi:hypothetical protein
VSGTEVRSVYKLPKMISYDTNIKIYPIGNSFKGGEWSYINKERFSFVGNNK